MKFLTAVMLSFSLLSAGSVWAQEKPLSINAASTQEKPKSCPCKDCKCTAQSHCGCYSDKGCTCGQDCACGSKCETH